MKFVFTTFVSNFSAMNRFLLSLSVLCCFTLTTTAQNKDQIIDIQSVIVDATVYLQGAVIVHNAEVNLKAGENIIRLSGLTTNLDPASVVVKATDGITIAGVSHKNNFSGASRMSSLARAKTDSLEDARFELEGKQALMAVYNEEMLFLQANRAIKGSDAALMVEDLEEMADFYRERVREIKYKSIELNQQERELQKLVQRLTNELNNMGGLENMNLGELQIRLKAATAGKKTIEISYFTYDAGWWPIYDLRAQDATSNVELTYKGNVYQRTGMDWENINLTLSTGNPGIGGNPPVLYPWQLYLREEYRKDKANAFYGIDQPQSRQSDDNYELGEMVLMRAEVGNATIRDVMVNTEFDLVGKYDIPSDGESHEVENQRFTLPSTFQHLTVPKLNKEVYLTALVTDWEKYSIIPGEASIYFQGSFVGNSYIDPATADDTLQLSFGRDGSMVVKHEQIKEFCKTSALGMKTKTTRAYSIKVVNNHKKAMKVVVEDQVPLSSTGDIEVDVEELSGGKLDAVTGKVTWELILEPGASKELILRFSAKHPRKRPIANL
ncbi:MAG: mucoidy inhibitor MuiA family protein [Cryomorphaceae bacterium]|nr:mucoidy inhibitor MuiA family protein [Cryomorphaceae bacterium]